MPALIVASPRSGSGKTTVTLGLVAALRRRGLSVRTLKSGPDYIDPAFLAAASGAPCFNADSWAMPRPAIAALLAHATTNADLVVIEGAMGLFDGADLTDAPNGATADLARLFGIPVLLVIDVSGQGQSAGAVARGFATHHEGVRIAGAVLNRCGSERHRAMAARAVQAAGVPVLGAIPRDPTIAVPERHLGLVQAQEHPALDAMLANLAHVAESHLDLDAIRHLATALPLPPALAIPTLTPPGSCVALAQDAVFSFVYPHALHAWRAAGADIRTFSPLADEPPPEDCDACWLPGGYPELHAARLAANRTFLDGLTAFARTRPVHGECGGYMVLGEWLEDADGVRHRMAGLLGHSTSFAKRKLSLGYRQARLRADTALGRTGTVWRGHEFHYATVLNPGEDSPLTETTDAAGHPLPSSGGSVRGHVSGGFFHILATHTATET